MTSALKALVASIGKKPVNRQGNTVVTPSQGSAGGAVSAVAGSGSVLPASPAVTAAVVSAATNAAATNTTAATTTPTLSGSFGWNVMTSAAFLPPGVSGTLLTLPIQLVSPAASSLTYYVRFTLDTPTGPLDGKTLYQLTGFSQQDLQSLSLSASGITFNGHPSFDPLTLTFTQPALAPALLKMLAAGTAFQEVDVFGYAGNASSGTAAIEYSFGLIGASSLSTDSSGQTTAALKYGSEEIQNLPTAPGSFFAWNEVQHHNNFSTDKGAGVQPIRAPAKGTAKVVAAVSNLTYYVRFTLNAANSNSPFDGKTLYQLTRFSSQDLNALGIGSSGITPGRTSFDPLTLTITQPALTSALLQMLVSGTAFKEVDVLGYAPVTGSPSTLAVDYSFGLVGASDVATNGSGQTIATLQYGSEEIQSYTTANGKTTADKTPGAWNAVNNTPTFSTDGTTVTAPLAAPTSLSGQSVSPPAAGSLTYYVRFAPNNPSGALDGSTLYQLTGLSTEDLRALSISASGIGAGRVSFDPLTLTLTQPALITALLTKLATGDKGGNYNGRFNEVDVLGYTPGRSGALAIDYSFGLVGLSGLSNDDSGQTTATLLYGSEEIRSYNTSLTGVTTLAQSAAWNAAGNSSGFSTGGSAPATPLAAPTTLAGQQVSPSAASSLDYYVRFPPTTGIVPLNGRSVYQLTGFSLQNLQSLSVLANGITAGTAGTDSLTLTFTQQALTPALLQILAGGATFSNVDIFGYVPGSSASATVVDYTLKTVATDGLSADSSGQMTVGLQFKLVTLNPSAQNPTLSSPGSKVASAATNLTYYVRFALNTAPASGNPFDGQTLYQLSGFSSQDLNSLTVGSNGITHGTTSFDPLSLTFTQPALTPALFQMLTSGTAFKEVDVLGYATSAAGALAVDYSFGLVGASDLSTGSSGQTTATLQYGSEEIQTYKDPSGNYNVQSPAWNVLNHTAAFSTNGSNNAIPLAAPAKLPANNLSPAASSLTYYVRFTPNSKSGPLDGQTLYQLTGFSSEDTQSLSISPSGIGAGKAGFDPLTLTFTQQALTPNLFNMLANGTAFKEVDVFGYAPATGSPSTLAVDYSFTTAAAGSLSNDGNGNTVVALQYGAESIQTYTIPLAAAATAAISSQSVSAAAPLTFVLGTTGSAAVTATGQPETFVFGQGSNTVWSDTINGFDVSQDIIQFASSQVASYAALSPLISANASGGTEISLGSEHLTLAGVTPGQLSSTNFHFV